ncbi:MAG: phosphoethanolamine transferase [Rickettsiaceae bacterium]|nr:phosphoethanolamine transferase [Rickettsiaceae bacterium]
MQKHLDIALFKNALSFALIYCVLFNSSVFIYKFEYQQADILKAILELVKDFVYLVVTLTIFFLGLSLNRKLFIVGSLILFITGALASYYLFFFSIAPTRNMMPALFGTNSTEVYELLSARLLAWLIFSVGMCIYSIKHFNVQPAKTFFTRVLSAVCLLLVVVNVITPKYSFLKTYYPVQYLHNVYTYFAGPASKHAKEDIATKFTYVDSSDADTVGVLVIGEAARYSNFGINGYERNTTPELSKIEDLSSFKARSCANNTYTSVPCMLSRYGEQDLDLVDSETSVLSVLTKLGFKTIWLGTQSISKYYKNKPGGSFYDEVNFHMIPGGTIVFQPNSHDGQMLPFLEENAKSEGKKFIVLHSTGSHWDYSKRYPKEFAQFQPDLNSAMKDDASSCNRESLVNSYDNSILYTDFFLSSVIDRLKDKKAFLIYASDHGESLGEKGRFTHGGDGYIPEQRTVPFIVWMSDSYKKSHPQKWSAIKSITDKNISHDHIFHSILDCLSIKSDIVDKSLSLCHTNSFDAK